MPYIPPPPQTPDDPGRTAPDSSDIAWFPAWFYYTTFGIIMSVVITVLHLIT